MKTRLGLGVAAAIAILLMGVGSASGQLIHACVSNLGVIRIIPTGIGPLDQCNPFTEKALSWPATAADNPALQPFQDSFSLQINPGSSAAKDQNFAINIPANTRLVIERINVLGELPVGQVLLGANVDAFVGGSASGSFTGTSFRGTSPSGVIFGGPLDIYSGDSAPSGMYADPGPNNLSLSAFRNQTTGTGHVFVQLYGHVVNLP